MAGLALVRRWAGAAWLILTVGMLAGAHWAYVELGWGGFWAWDPVENAALLPWLGAAALLHATLLDEHRSRVRASTVALALGTNVVALVGALLTRSGAVSSVHAFGAAVNVGRALLVLVVVVGVSSAVLLRRRQPAPQGQAVGQPAGPAGPRRQGRREMLVLNALLVLSVALVVAWGTLFPLAAELAGRRSFVVSGRFFALLAAPLALAALALIGLAPLLRWRGGVTPGGRRSLPWAAVAAMAAGSGAVLDGLRAPFALVAVPLAAFSTVLLTTELARRLHAPGPPEARRRAAGAVLAHLGVVVFLVGVAGSTTGRTATIVLAPGEQASVAGYDLRHDGVAVGLAQPASSAPPSPSAPGSRTGGIPTPSDDQIAAGTRVITLDLALLRGDALVATLRPSQEVFEQRGLVLAETALRSTPVDDVLVAIRRVGDDGTAVLEVSVRPLAVWVWWGWILVAVGGGLALAGPRRATTVPVVPASTTAGWVGPAPTAAVRVGPGPPACVPAGGPPSPAAPGRGVLRRAVAADDPGRVAGVPVPAGPGATEAVGPGRPPPGPPLGATWPPSPTGPGG
jgi:cytochrome c-type biogenesis protein CcmF